jgi:hypothetical protein
MSETSETTRFTPPAPTYITPIKCPHCQGEARLIHRSPAITGDGKGEMRIFTCDRCSERTELFIRDELPVPGEPEDAA